MAPKPKVDSGGVKSWRKELKQLSEEKNFSLEQVAEYIGVEVQAEPTFYKRLPKKREVFIAIGMAFKLPVDEINRWIRDYGKKKKLYVKDVMGDIVWIYLININSIDEDRATNYYDLYDECRDAIETAYLDIWRDCSVTAPSTTIIESKMKAVAYDPDNLGIITFIAENINAFRTAYIKPRRLLNAYIENILAIKNRYRGDGREYTLYSLKGYLDDSMINYLSGSMETINVLAEGRNERSANIKHVPKNKRTHIALCLALGMTAPDINEYLEMMGYSPLDEDEQDEAALLEMLEAWESENVHQQLFKDKYIRHIPGICISNADEAEAVEEMLNLRADLKVMYEEGQRKTLSSGKPNPHFREFRYLAD